MTCDVWLFSSPTRTHPSFGLSAAAEPNCDESDFSRILARCTSVQPQLRHLRLLFSVAVVLPLQQRGVLVDRVTRLTRRRCSRRLWRIQQRRGGEGLKTRHTSHVTLHTSYVARRTSHVTRHTSHVTRHTSHVTRHTSHLMQRFGCFDSQQRTVPGTFRGACEQQQQQQQQHAQSSVVLTIQRIARVLSDIVLAEIHFSWTKRLLSHICCFVYFTSRFFVKWR